MTTCDTVAAQPLEQAHRDALVAAHLAAESASQFRRAEIRACISLEAAAIHYADAKATHTLAEERARLAWDAADAATDAMVAAGLPDPRKQGEP